MPIGSERVVFLVIIMSILDSKVFYNLAKVSGVVIESFDDKFVKLTSHHNPVNFCKEFAKTFKGTVTCKRIGNIFQITVRATI